MKLLTIVVATVAVATSAFGALYETPVQFETRKPYNVTTLNSGNTVMTWVGPKIVHMGWFSSDGRRVSKCISESFWYRDQHRMTEAEVTKFLAPYYQRGIEGRTSYLRCKWAKRFRVAGKQLRKRHSLLPV
jgi:hypothetical protein